MPNCSSPASHVSHTLGSRPISLKWWSGELLQITLYDGFYAWARGWGWGRAGTTPGRGCSLGDLNLCSYLSSCILVLLWFPHMGLWWADGPVWGTLEQPNKVLFGLPLLPLSFWTPLWVGRWFLLQNLTVTAPYINLVLAGDLTSPAFKFSFDLIR